MKENLLIKNAKAIKPLVKAVSKGEDLEFKHNDGKWRLWRGHTFVEVAMSPHRFRIAK